MPADVRNVQQEIVDALHKQVEADHGGTITNFSVGWEAATWKLVGFELDPVDPTKLDPETVAHTSWKNCTRAVDRQEWKDTFSTTDSFTYSFTEGLKLGASVTAKAEIPLVGGGKVQFSAEMDFSATQSKTVLHTRSREITESISISACQTTTAQLLLYKGRFDVPFRARVKAGGHLYYTGKIPRGSVGPAPGGLDVDAVLQRAGIVNDFDASGTINGVVGLMTQIETHSSKAECEPDDDCTG